MLLEPGFWGALLGGALRLATPLALAAFGELLVQRAGLVNLGIEGMMVCGCLAGVVGAAAGGWEAGLALGAGSGAVLGALLAATVLLGKAEVVVAGIGIGVLATGAADYGFDLWLRHGSAAVPVFAPVLPLPWSDRWPPTLAAILTQSLVSWATLVLGLLLGAWLRYGRAGPVLEAVGSAPEIARLRGVAVARWQAASLVLGGTLAGIAGAALTVTYVGSFTSGMSGGRGFIAIAMVLLARGRAARLGLAALGFALLESAGLQLQGRSSIVLVALGTMLPYLATLAALGMTGVARRRPSAAGGVSVMGALSRWICASDASRPASGRRGRLKPVQRNHATGPSGARATARARSTPGRLRMQGGAPAAEISADEAIAARRPPHGAAWHAPCFDENTTTRACPGTAGSLHRPEQLKQSPDVGAGTVGGKRSAQAPRFRMP